MELNSLSSQWLQSFPQSGELLNLRLEGVKNYQKERIGYKWHVNLSLSKHDPANHKLEGSNHKDCDLYRP